jgi:hypothetical protein
MHKTGAMNVLRVALYQIKSENQIASDLIELPAGIVLRYYGHEPRNTLCVAKPL